MLVVGVYWGPDAHAVSIARDGCIVSALSGAGQLSTHLADAVVLDTLHQCLDTAGVEAKDIDEVVIATHGAPTLLHNREPGFSNYSEHPAFTALSGVKTTSIPLDIAHASFMRCSSRSTTAGLIVSSPFGAPSSLVHLSDGKILESRPLDGMADVIRLISTGAAALGHQEGQSALAYLESVACGGGVEAVSKLVALSTDDTYSISCNRHAVDSFLEFARANSPAPLDKRSEHVEVQRIRRRVARAFVEHLAVVIGELAVRWSGEIGANTTVMAGDVMQVRRFHARVAATLSQGSLSAHASESAALGAALFPFADVSAIRSLGLGHTFEETDVKRALDNCRLDYVYEPDWGLLVNRVSEVLASGALVAWCQGRADFGSCSLGSRSVLADPSVRYARENVNAYLLERPVSEEIPLVIAPAAASSLVGTRMLSDRYVSAFPVPEAWRQQLAGAIDVTGNAFVTVGSEDANQELAGLLNAHFARTGVPGLLNVPLRGASSPLARTPKDAIRSSFGSAVDMLVMGRFFLSKDYWLIRRRRS